MRFISKTNDIKVDTSPIATALESLPQNLNMPFSKNKDETQEFCKYFGSLIRQASAIESVEFCRTLEGSICDFLKIKPRNWDSWEKVARIRWDIIHIIPYLYELNPQLESCDYILRQKYQLFAESVLENYSMHNQKRYSEFPLFTE